MSCETWAQAFELIFVQEAREGCPVHEGHERSLWPGNAGRS